MIEPSKIPWFSPICLLSEKEGDYCFRIDFRKVTAETKNDSHAFLYISSILDRLRVFRFIGSIDIKSTFWYIPLSESSREITDFIVPGRYLYDFKRISSGLTNDPATWQRLFDFVLDVYLKDNAMVYLDDFILISKTFQESLRLFATFLTV